MRFSAAGVHRQAKRKHFAIIYYLTKGVDFQ